MDKNEIFEELFNKGIPASIMFFGLIVIIVLGKYCVGSGINQLSGAPAFERGDSVPEMKLSFLYRDNPVALSYLCKEKPVLLLFTSSGCRYCEMQMSDLDGQMKIDDAFEVLVVSSSHEALLKRKKKDGEIPFSVVLDRNKRLARAFKVNAYPTSVLLGGKREFIFQDIGYNVKLRNTVMAHLSRQEKE